MRTGSFHLLSAPPPLWMSGSLPVRYWELADSLGQFLVVRYWELAADSSIPTVYFSEIGFLQVKFWPDLIHEGGMTLFFSIWHHKIYTFLGFRCISSIPTGYFSEIRFLQVKFRPELIHGGVRKINGIIGMTTLSQYWRLYLLYHQPRSQ